MAANIERGSVPSSMELRGSGGAEEDEEEEEDEVLPLRVPRRVFESVTCSREEKLSGRSRIHEGGVGASLIP